MNCPTCDESKTTVLETRNTKKGMRRRRECPLCKTRWTTFEVLVEGSVYVPLGARRFADAWRKVNAADRSR